MTTLGTMKARISRDLARPDFPSTSQDIADAINTAIAEYQRERFRFSDTIPNAPPTFNTVATRYIYTSSDNANIGSVLKIDRVLITIGNTLQELARDPGGATNVILYNQVNTMNGQPSSYAYEGNQLLLAPIPDAVYTITLGLFRLVAAPTADDEANNPWMTEAELLIRSRAKYEIAVHRTRNATMAEAMSPFPPAPGQKPGASWAAWRAMKASTNRVMSKGRVRPVRF